MSDFYKCAICEGTFLSIWPDEEAKAEFEELFGKPYSADEHGTLCDDCFGKAFADMNVLPEP